MWLKIKILRLNAKRQNKYNININKTQPDKQVTMGRKPSQNKRRLMCAQNYL